MAKEWGGKTYNENWEEIDAMGNVLGGKDWSANASYAAANNTQNPYTNQAGASPWDKSGLTPGNEPGSTLPPVQAGANPATGSTSSAGLDGAVMSKLLSEISMDGTVNQNDPAYRQAVDANQLQTDRYADRARAASAQRRAATGTGTSGAVDTDVNRILSEQTTQDKAFEGQLLGKFRDQNLDRMSRALTLGAGMLTAEQERALRAALTREGYGVQKELAGNDLSFRRDALGQQAALSLADLDQRAMLALLGGD
jgi:hypothetical protein